MIICSPEMNEFIIPLDFKFKLFDLKKLTL